MAQINTQLDAIRTHSAMHEKLDRHDELTHHAQELVAQSFFGNLLKQARSSPFHSDMFDGGKGGAAYQELFDQKLAEHMSSGVGSKIVRPLIHKFKANQAYQKHKTARAGRHVHGFGTSGKAQGSQQASSFLSQMAGA